MLRDGLFYEILFSCPQMHLTPNSCFVAWRNWGIGRQLIFQNMTSRVIKMMLCQKGGYVLFLVDDCRTSLFSNACVVCRKKCFSVSMLGAQNSFVLSVKPVLPCLKILLEKKLSILLKQGKIIKSFYFLNDMVKSFQPFILFQCCPSCTNHS